MKNRLKSNVVYKTTLMSFGIQGRYSLFSTVFVAQCIVNPVGQDDKRSIKNTLPFGRIAKDLRDKIRQKQGKIVEDGSWISHEDQIHHYSVEQQM